mgnify:CR=1 FL=1
MTPDPQAGADASVACRLCGGPTTKPAFQLDTNIWWCPACKKPTRNVGADASGAGGQDKVHTSHCSCRYVRDTLRAEVSRLTALVSSHEQTIANQGDRIHRQQEDVEKLIAERDRSEPMNDASGAALTVGEIRTTIDTGQFDDTWAGDAFAVLLHEIGDSKQRGADASRAERNVEAIRQRVSGSHPPSRAWYPLGEQEILHLLTEVERLMAELEQARRPIGETYACQACGRQDGLDAVASTDLWERISGELGILCLWCMDRRANAAGVTASVTLHFAGYALHGSSESDADREFIGRLVRQKEDAEERARLAEQRVEQMRVVVEAAKAMCALLWTGGKADVFDAAHRRLEGALEALAESAQGRSELEESLKRGRADIVAGRSKTFDNVENVIADIEDAPGLEGGRDG